ncbi:MAG: type VI secretion system baseplate subunit TssF, partial [Candidatus Adiutricales bacterium]
RHYQQELQNLKELAVEFSKAHPALAPMLSGQTQDPDVERLLEGVAFLTGMLREKLEDEFPEIIHGLLDLIFPHYLRPAPSTTMIALIRNRI